MLPPLLILGTLAGLKLLSNASKKRNKKPGKIAPGAITQSKKLNQIPAFKRATVLKSKVLPSKNIQAKPAVNPMNTDVFYEVPGQDTNFKPGLEFEEVHDLFYNNPEGFPDLD